MKLGFRRFKLFEGDFPALFAFAHQIGADMIQIGNLSQSDVDELKKLMQQSQIGISSIEAMSWKILGPDMEIAKEDQRKVRDAIIIAQQLGVTCVSQFAGNDPSKSFEENIETFKDVYTPLARLAEDAGVKLVFENCPLYSGLPPVVHNLAYSPAAWQAMFEAVPSEAIGLEFDTAHTPWLGIDTYRCLKDFGHKIHHVHLKDCIIDDEAQYQYGRLGNKFYRYGVPGDGGIDFSEFIQALNEIGYEGTITLDLRPTTEETIRRGAAFIREILSRFDNS